MNPIVYAGNQRVSTFHNVSGLTSNDLLNNSYICVFCGNIFSSDSQKCSCLESRILQYIPKDKDYKEKVNNFINENAKFYVRKTGKHNVHIFSDKEELSKFEKEKEERRQHFQEVVEKRERERKEAEERYARERIEKQNKIDFVNNIFIPELDCNIGECTITQLVYNISKILKYVDAENLEYYLEEHFDYLYSKQIREDIIEGRFSSNINFY